MRELKDFAWEQLPEWVVESDTRIDEQGNGLLKRYLGSMGEELDQEVIPMIDGILNEIDPTTATNDSLSLIAFKVGNPTDVLENIQAYRTLLTQIITLYKIKGTRKSYEMLFGLWGYTVTIQELYITDVTFDIGLKFDEGHKMDTNSCEEYCSDYILTYSPIPGLTNSPLTGAQVTKAIQFIKDYIEPINAQLINIIYKP